MIMLSLLYDCCVCFLDILDALNLAAKSGCTIFSLRFMIP